MECVILSLILGVGLSFVGFMLLAVVISAATSGAKLGAKIRKEINR